jgi:hypothetical protein
MKYNKVILGGSLCVLIIILTQFILKATEVTGFFTQITVATIFGGATLVVIYMLSNKNKFFGFKLTLISTILMLTMCLFVSIDFIVSESIPQITITHRSLSIGMDILAGSSILVFIILLVVAASITAKKNQR